jgi:hypothetical protein
VEIAQKLSLLTPFLLISNRLPGISRHIFLHPRRAIPTHPTKQLSISIRMAIHLHLGEVLKP